MAVYLFVLMSVSILVNVIQIIRKSDIGERLGFLVGTSAVMPPYIWFGWFSELIF